MRHHSLLLLLPGKTRIDTYLHTLSLWWTVASLTIYTSTFSLWDTRTATLISCLAGSQHSWKVSLHYSSTLFSAPCTPLHEYLSYSRRLFLFSAHSAYTWDELAEAIRRSYLGINQVLVLKKFINWSASIDPYLNDATKTDGMSGFSMFLVTYSSSDW